MRASYGIILLRECMPSIKLKVYFQDIPNQSGFWFEYVIMLTRYCSNLSFCVNINDRGVISALTLQTGNTSTVQPATANARCGNASVATLARSVAASNAVRSLHRGKEYFRTILLLLCDDYHKISIHVIHGSLHPQRQRGGRLGRLSL